MATCTRIDDPLQNTRRREIYEFVETVGMTSMDQLRKEFIPRYKIRSSNIQYHLYVLVRKGFLSETINGKEKYYSLKAH